MGLAATVAILVSCADKLPEFEVMGIKLDITTIDAARKLHSNMTCDSRYSTIPDYKTCRVENLDVAKITTTMWLDVNQKGVVTAISLRGEHYDGPHYNYWVAMNEKYGNGYKDERGDLFWTGSNGKATLTKMKDGGARLSFEGIQYSEDLAALRRNLEKGAKF